jgi:hypothetical protein
MSSTNSYLPPQSSTPFADQRFKLPRHFVFIEMVLFSLISTLMIFAWLPAILSIFTYNMVLPSALRAALFLNVTAVCLILLILFMKRELRSVEFIINDEVVVRKGLTSLRQIRIAAIQTVSFVKFPVTGGVIVIETSRGSLTVPLMLADITRFVTILEHVCRHSEGTFRFSSTQFNDLMRIAKRTEDKQKRASAMFGPLLSISITLLPVNVFVGAVFWDMSIVPLMMWSITGPLFPIVFYSVTNGILLVSEKRREGSGSVVDQHLQVVRVYGVSGYMFGSLYLISGIMFKALVL